MPFAGEIWYKQAGNGPPVLFVHGWCMSSAVWQLQMEGLSSRYRTISIDLRGHGKSPLQPVTGFSDYAADIAAVVNEFDLQNLVLVGWSMGGQAVLKSWPLLRQRVAGLVLVGTTPRFSASQDFPHALPLKDAQGMGLKLRRNLAGTLQGFQQSMFAAGELETAQQEALANSVLDQVELPGSEAALAGLDALMNEELFSEVEQLDCPVLLIHGDQDQICLPQASAWLADRIAGNQRIIFQGCGHAPFLSRPEQFNQHLLQFLDGIYDRD